MTSQNHLSDKINMNTNSFKELEEKASLLESKYYDLIYGNSQKKSVINRDMMHPLY